MTTQHRIPPTRTTFADDPNAQLFFCHIPKTAGMTLTALLERHFWKREILPYTMMGEFPGNLSVRAFRRARLIRGHFHLYPLHHLLEKPPVTITMLRHPIQRIISAFQHMRNDSTHALHHAIGGKTATLEQFLQADINPAQYINTHVSFLSALPQHEPTVRGMQRTHSYVVREPEKYWSLERAKETLEQIAFFGITEDFDRSMDVLTHVLGWEPITHVESRNVGAYRRQQYEPDPATIERLHELNRLDLDFYAYAVRLFEERTRHVIRESLWDAYVERQRRHDAPKHLHLSFEGPIAGSGWHDREFSRHRRAFCWSGPSGRASIYAVVAPAEQMKLRIGVLHAIDQRALDEMVVRINGEPLRLAYRTGSFWHITWAEATFPGALIAQSPVTRIDFELPYTVAPRDVIPDASDSRRLSVAVTSLDIGPASASFDLYQVKDWVRAYLR